MNDDLIAQLRAEGHDAEADSLERKLNGEPDPGPEPRIYAFGGDDDAEVAAVVAALDRDIPD